MYAQPELSTIQQSSDKFNNSINDSFCCAKTYLRADIMEEEIWVDVIKYEGKYKVSNNGKVKSLSRERKIGLTNIQIMPEIILKNLISKKGYLNVVLCKNGKVKAHRISRLVAQHFIPNPENKPDVNHKDGNKLNNNVNNLEWATPLENMKHAFKTGLRNCMIGENHFNAKLTRQQVDEILQLRKQGWKLKALGEKYKVDTTTINKITVGKHWVKKLGGINE